LTPRFTKAAIDSSGMPHNPNPPIITVAPGGISAIAASALGKTFVMIYSFRDPFHHKTVNHLG
jgi:hypothetical protein